MNEEKKEIRNLIQKDPLLLDQLAKIHSELTTHDPLITVDTRLPIAYLSLGSLQPRLHKRLTKNVKAKHLADILAATVEVFTDCP